jgi:hypothetical protein
MNRVYVVVGFLLSVVLLYAARSAGHHDMALAGAAFVGFFLGVVLEGED